MLINDNEKALKNTFQGFFTVVCVQQQCARFVKIGFVGALIMDDIVGTTGRSENLGWNAVGTILSRKNTSQNSAFH